MKGTFSNWLLKMKWNDTVSPFYNPLWFDAGSIKHQQFLTYTNIAYLNIAATFCHLPEGIKFETDPLSGLASGLQELQKTEEYHVELYRESTLGCSVGPVARVQQRLQWKETKGATYRLLTSKRYLKNWNNDSV